MALYIVTIKVPTNPNHDLENKKWGPCPIAPTNGVPFPIDCSDVTGAHHSFLVESDAPLSEIREALWQTYHVTRIEDAWYPAIEGL